MLQWIKISTIMDANKAEKDREEVAKSRERAAQALEKSEALSRRYLIVQKKRELSDAIEAGPKEILHWCHRRALEKYMIKGIHDLTVYGSSNEITEDETLIIAHNMQRWYHRICTWWGIDPGYGEGH